eukprot:6416903-Amphidinium_carterae.1
MMTLQNKATSSQASARQEHGMYVGSAILRAFARRIELKQCDFEVKFYLSDSNLRRDAFFHDVISSAEGMLSGTHFSSTSQSGSDLSSF